MPITRNKLDIFIICAPGLETVARAEMLRLGVTPSSSEPGGISCKGFLEDVMRLNLCLRTASRVVVRIATFHASTFHELERRARKIDWKQFVQSSGASTFRVTCRKSKLYHSDAVAERFANSLLAQIPEAKLEKSDDGDDDDSQSGPGQQFIVRLFRDEVTVSADSSGELLHKRGYRLASAKAPIRETLAAGMLLAADWNGHQPLLDPLCGSGTLAIEAALIARNISPGGRRDFAFMNWPEFDHGAWDAMLKEADRKSLTTANAKIFASDRDEGAVNATRANAERAGVAEDMDISRASMTEAIEQASALDPPGFLVANPPYGKRVGEAADPRDLYSSLGKSAREKLPGWTLLMVSNEARLISQLKVPFERLFSASNGGIPVQVVKGVVPAHGL